MTPNDPTTPTLNPTLASDTASGLLVEPAFEESHSEWIQYHEDLHAGHLHLDEVPEGHHIAYYSGHIVDHDPDPILLRNRAASSLGIHPARIVIDYPWM